MAAADDESGGFSGSVFQPTNPEFPPLIIIFKDGELATYRAVATVDEGEALLAEHLKTLPTLG